MKTIIAVLILTTCLTSCLFEQAVPPVDWPGDPEPIEQDTPCAPVLYNDPAFITAELEILEQVVTPIVVCWGNVCDTVASLNEDEMSTLGEAYRPQYSYTTTIKDTDDGVLSTIVKGTNNKGDFLGKVYVRYNGKKHFLGFASQGFMFAGSHTGEEYLSRIDEYPSVARFNIRNTQYDSLTELKIALKILDCRVGKDWADFRFNHYQLSDSIINAFIAAGWNDVLHAAPGSMPRERMSHIVDLTAETKHGEQYPESVRYFLSKGYQVIVTDREKI